MNRLQHALSNTNDKTYIQQLALRQRRAHFLMLSPFSLPVEIIGKDTAMVSFLDKNDMLTKILLLALNASTIPSWPS